MGTDNLTIARRYLGDLWTDGDLDLVDELVAPTCQVRDPLFGGCVGPAGLRDHIREMRGAFPDLSFTCEALLAEAGQQLALTWSATGTHRGPLLGILATGRRIELTGLLLLRVVGTRLVTITTHWEPWDLLRQLELVSDSPAPAPGATAAPPPGATAHARPPRRLRTATPHPADEITGPTQPRARGPAVRPRPADEPATAAETAAAAAIAAEIASAGIAVADVAAAEAAVTAVIATESTVPVRAPRRTARPSWPEPSALDAAWEL